LIGFGFDLAKALRADHYVARVHYNIDVTEPGRRPRALHKSSITRLSDTNHIDIETCGLNWFQRAN
jgi:hypothetical protein